MTCKQRGSQAPTPARPHPHPPPALCPPAGQLPLPSAFPDPPGLLWGPVQRLVGNMASLQGHVREQVSSTCCWTRWEEGLGPVPPRRDPSGWETPRWAVSGAGTTQLQREAGGLREDLRGGTSPRTGTRPQSSLRECGPGPRRGVSHRVGGRPQRPFSPRTVSQQPQGLNHAPAPAFSPPPPHAPS